MLNIVVRFSLPTGYRSQFVTLDGQGHTLNFTFHDGTNTAKSDFVDLGVIQGFGGRRLIGQFSFKYNYDSTRQVVTVCGTDFESADSMCLTTAPEGTQEYCRQWAGGGGFLADDLTTNPHWNYRTPLTPGLQDVLAGVVRTVNARLIEALMKDASKLTVQTRTPPPELSPEDEAKFLAVYKNGAFQGLHEPGRVYGPEETVVSVGSVWGGEVRFSLGEKFANVIGSTNDPKIAGLTWIQLWSQHYNQSPVTCTSFQSNGFNCGGILVGGHVITGTQAQVVQAGSNSVYIFPICDNHNKNNNVYMEALKYLNGVWLNNYLGR